MEDRTSKMIQMAMYGALKDEIIASVERSITFKCSGVGMVIMSYASDVQEMLARGFNDDQARQYLNIIKMLIDHYKLGRVARDGE